MNEVVDQKVTCTRVEDSEERMNFLPKHVGMRHMMLFEAIVYRFAEMYCEAYNGGMWEFYELSNGAFFMAPSGDEKMLFVNGDNFSEVELSPQAFGVVITCYALSYFANKDGLSDADIEKFGSNYHYVRDFLMDHDEVQPMLKAID